MWYYLKVLALILSPIQIPVNSHAEPEEWAALKKISLEMEIVGPHENWADNFDSELKYVYNYSRELHDAPPICDSFRFPDSSVSYKMIEFNTQFQCYCEEQIILSPTKCDYYRETLSETRELNCIWYSIKKANTRSEPWVYQRRAMKQIKEIIGDKAYAEGDFPPCVPLHRFRKID